MNIRLIQDGDLDQLFYTFKMAFTDYEVKFRPTKEEFAHRINQKLHYQSGISAGSFDGDEMTGFILHASNLYEGIPTAYNGGTGVLPGFRNQTLAGQMYDFLIPKIQQQSIARILLEVVETNKRALALYEKIGFTFKRRFKCYKLTKEPNHESSLSVINGNMNQVNFHFNDFEPSFMDSSEHLKLGHERVLIAQDDNKNIGFLIFQPHVGRISQLSVDRMHRHRGVASALLMHAHKAAKKSLTIMNIPEDEHGFDSFLKEFGFENQVNQFEMQLII